MEHLRRRKENPKRPQESSRHGQALEDFRPTVEWHQNPSTHILIVDLPGFRKDDLRVQVDGSGRITIKGTRQVTVSKGHRVDETFQAPEDANIEQISGKLDEGRMTLTIPRRVRTTTSTEPSSSTEGAGVAETAGGEENGGARMESGYGREQEEKGQSWLGEEDVAACELVARLLEKVNDNQKVISAAVVAFAVGFYVSRIMSSR